MFKKRLKSENKSKTWTAPTLYSYLEEVVAFGMQG